MENTKKMLSKLLFALFISLTLVNCKEQQPKEDPKPETVDRPSEIIEVDVARQQYLTYEKRRVDLIQKYEDSIDGYGEKGRMLQEQNDQRAQVDPNDPNGERFDVARYVYWDYKTIKNYLKYIEKEAKDANVEISTLRFYFSNYPADDKAAVHPRQNSIIITPTLNENDREYIFAIDDSDAENIKPQLLTNSFVPIDTSMEKGMGNFDERKERSHASFFSTAFETTSANTNLLPFYAGKSVTMNRGTSVPPPHNEQ